MSANLGHDCDIAIANINNAARVLGRKGSTNASYSYKDYENDLKGAAKKLVGAMAKIIHSSQDSPESLGVQSKAAAAVFPDLFAAVVGEMALTSSPDLSENLLKAAQALANACKGLVEAAKVVQNSPNDQAAKSAVSSEGDGVTKAITGLLKASKKAASQQRESEEAKRKIEEGIIELNTSEYLSSNDQLYVRSSDPFKKHEHKIDAQCKSVAHAVSELIKGSASGNSKKLGKVCLSSADGMCRAAVCVAVC